MKEDNEIIHRLAEADSGLAFEPDPGFMAGLVAAEQPATGMRWFRKPVAAGVLLAAALTGTALAAGGSKPGDALFGLKAAAQDVLASSTADGLEEAERLLDLAETRISEARTAKASGEEAIAEDLLQLAEDNIDSAIEAAEDTDHEDAIRTRAEELRDAIEHLRASSPSDDDDRRGPTPSPSPSDDDDHSGPGSGNDPDEPDDEPSPMPTESEEPHDEPSPSPTHSDDPDEPDDSPSPSSSSSDSRSSGRDSD